MRKSPGVRWFDECPGRFLEEELSAGECGIFGSGCKGEQWLFLARLRVHLVGVAGLLPGYAKLGIAGWPGQVCRWLAVSVCNLFGFALPGEVLWQQRQKQEN